MSQRSRHRRRSRNGGVGKAVFAVVATIGGLLALGLAGTAIWVLDVASSAPSIDSLKPANSGANSEVFAANGDSLGYVQSDILREPVKLKDVPRSLQRATVAIEDEHFYEHGGVDYGAIVRAGLKNLEAGEVRQGASTITQQLVRNLYIDDPEDTIQRKIREAEMAREYEQEYSKDKILEKYLNTASYGTNDGRTAVGVKTAAEVYFDKSISKLGVRESALLAGLPQAPTSYNPFLNPEGAKSRRNQVLDAMAEQGYISATKAERVKRRGLGLERGDRYTQRSEPYFFDYVQDELIRRYGTKRVRTGGLRVYTTLEPKLQEAAEAAIANNPVSGAASALVSTNADTGEILAMASSQSYDSSQFNLAADGERQPGSSFKPFVLTTAIDQGMDPETTTYPAPSTITLQPDPAGDPWTVSGGGRGSMTLAQATAFSTNTVYAQLGVDVGPDNFVRMAHKLGVTSHLDGYYAEALGGTTSCCTVLEMSNAYATFANGGVHHDPIAIRKVEFPNGDVDKPKNPDGKRVISDGVAYEVAKVMRGPLDTPGGTAYGYGIGCPASGKTGTTDDQVDAWFVGYTPHVSTAVWSGNPTTRTPLPGYGADLSAPIWHDYMMVAATQPCDDFPKPKNPASLSSFSGGHSSDSASYDDESSDSTDADTGDDNGGGDEPEDADGDGYPDDAYAPGVGQ